jgi:[ribosomal protein S18]-alanine N-acetyltransferase
MRGWLTRWITGARPVIAGAGPAAAASLATLHAASFRRGWTEAEFERLLVDRDVLAHEAVIGRKLVGFILSRRAAGDAEILTVAVARSDRGCGVAGALLDVHLRNLAGLGAEAVFLEVEDDNPPARRLYARRGFLQVGERRGYYARPDGRVSTALILRRDLA